MIASHDGCDLPMCNVDLERQWKRRVRKACKRGRISPLEKKRLLDKLLVDGIAESAIDKAAWRVR